MLIKHHNNKIQETPERAKKAPQRIEDQMGDRLDCDCGCTFVIEIYPTEFEIQDTDVIICPCCGLVLDEANVVEEKKDLSHIKIVT